jgi:hypothetical protein
MGNKSVPKFIFRLSGFPVYRGSVLGRFYCTCKCVPGDGPYSSKHVGILFEKALRSCVCTVMAFLYVSLICDDSVTTQNLRFLRRNF